MAEHEMVALDDVPEWSCGGYVYDDLLAPKFGQEIRDGVAYPYLIEPEPVILTDDTPIARLRFIRREDCPVHGGQTEMGGMGG